MMLATLARSPTNAHFAFQFLCSTTNKSAAATATAATAANWVCAFSDM